MENIEDKEGEIKAALSTVVFALSSENHKRGVRSATYAGIFLSKMTFKCKTQFFLQSKLIELQMVFSQKCKFR